MREYLREAMDIVNADLADFSDPRKDAADFHEMSAGKQDNPFLKLLGSLRGEDTWCHMFHRVSDCAWYRSLGRWKR